MPSSIEVEFAAEVVREAALLARDIQASMVSPGLTKEDRSPVTVADFAVQALISYRLANRFPSATLIGEESSATLREDSSRPLLDQITKHLSTRVPEATYESVLEWIDRGR